MMSGNNDGDRFEHFQSIRASSTPTASREVPGSGIALRWDRRLEAETYESTDPGVVKFGDSNVGEITNLKLTRIPYRMRSMVDGYVTGRLFQGVFGKVYGVPEETPRNRLPREIIHKCRIEIPLRKVGSEQFFLAVISGIVLETSLLRERGEDYSFNQEHFRIDDADRNVLMRTRP